jgi:hypothetical protein
MRSRIAGLALTLSWAAWAGGVGCGGGSGGTGNAGHGGGGHAGGGTGGGTAGSTAGTGGGTAGAAAGTGGGTAGGTAGADGGMAGSMAGTGGAAGTTDGGAGMDGAAGADAGSDPFPVVTIPPAIAVPTGATLKFKAHGRGSQVYTCTATDTPVDGGADAGDGGADASVTTYSWVLKAPDAKLYNQDGAQIGTHFAGPTWMSTVDESDAVGMKTKSSPGTTANDVPWLLLQVVSHMGTGVFTDVTYVQRLNTMGGVAPATGCDSTKVGMDTSVTYSAEYYFYTGGVTAADGGTAAQWPFTAVTIPDAIATGAGPTLKLKLHGWGDQIYTCTASGGADAGADAGATTYSWVLKAPSATLYDDTDTKQGIHSMGPTWTANDTSAIVGMKLYSATAPAADAIPWLLLKVTSHSGATGLFSDVTYVQRLNTSKGVAPATGCDAAHVNMDTKVGYSADYYFYTGDTATDGGADGSD